MVCMSKVSQPAPYTNGAPGFTNWCSTRPLSISALPVTTTPVMLAGAVVPAVGAGAYTSGMSSSAHAMILLRANSSCMSGGEGMPYTMRLSPPPQASAICFMMASVWPSRGTISRGLRVPLSSATCW